MNNFFVLLLFTCLWKNASSQDLNLDWNKLSAKSHNIMYVNVTVDTTFNEGPYPRKWSYNLEENVHYVTKKELKLLFTLWTDTIYHSKMKDTEVCKVYNFSKAIVIMNDRKEQGMVDIMCDNRVFYFTPFFNGIDSIVLNDKGIELWRKIIGKS